jgi:3'-phosphoadenosine 5'-phosphosulfate sulfotransferase (PAPS reductase)/FAD synthetase
MADFIDKLAIPPEIDTALRDDAALSLSCSGGKDSDAMAVLLQRFKEQRGYPGPIEIVHCDMGRSEWAFTKTYVQRRGQELGIPVAIVRNAERDLQDLFVQRSQKRPDVPLWPSAAQRYCTSDKVGQIDKHLRAWVGKLNGLLTYASLYDPDIALTRSVCSASVSSWIPPKPIIAAF